MSVYQIKLLKSYSKIKSVHWFNTEDGNIGLLGKHAGDLLSKIHNAIHEKSDITKSEYKSAISHIKRLTECVGVRNKQIASLKADNESMLGELVATRKRARVWAALAAVGAITSLSSVAMMYSMFL